jgi:predicted permease
MATPREPSQLEPAGRPARKRRFLRFWRTDPVADVNEEVSFHLDSLIAENVAAGMNPDAAREAATRRFGDVEGTTRTLRLLSTQREHTIRLAERLETVGQDIRFALRQLLRSPVLTTVAVITMALGVGANSAIFSVVYSVLLRPLPYANADRVLNLRERNGPNDSFGMVVTMGNFGAWEEQARGFEAFGAYAFGSYTLTGAGNPQRLSATRASAGYWKTLYIPPTLGRYFDRDEDRPGAPHVVVLSHALWISTFHADSQVVGRAITLSGEPYTVIGVAGAGYAELPYAAPIWTPLALSASELAEHSDHELSVAGLLRHGVSKEQAVADLTRIETALARQYPHAFFDGNILATPERDIVVGPVKTLLLLLTGAVGLVLLIACVNVANLLLARAAARRKEIAIRTALGAGRRRIVAQLLVESLVLAMAGAAAGLAVAEAAIRFLIARAPLFVPRVHDATLNGPVLAFTIVLAVVCGVAFGLVPALRASKLDLQDTLRDGGRGSAPAIRDRLRGALVVAEVSVAMVLLVGAGLCLRSAWLLQRVPPGFDTRNLLVTTIGLPETRYASDASVVSAFRRIADAAGAVPGVESAGLVSRIPIGSGGYDCVARLEGSAVTDGSGRGANVRGISPNYFSVLRVPLVRGRAFRATDDATAPLVVMINASLARELFGDADPIGKRIANCPGGPALREVIGVVGDTHANGLRRGTADEVYFPYAQFTQRSMWLAVRGSVPVTSLTPAIRKAVAAIDPELPLSGLSTMENVVARSIATPRFTTTLFALLGALGLLLAAIGIYGVIAYFVSQRTHELGVRMALGASAQRLVGLVVRQGLMFALIGVAIGSAISLAATQLMSGLLFGVTAHDPLTFAGVAGLLTAVAVAASFVPAWRATRVDPLEALRSS